MMTYKETLSFIGKCLTINYEKHNSLFVEKDLKSGHVDWDSVVKISASHYVFPTLYCNFKRANFLHYLPEELVNYLTHITDLNRQRNEQIMAQAKEINTILLANNITPIFLKGTGNLLEGLYDDIAERIVGDIDFLVAPEEFKTTVSLLKKDGYYAVSKEHSEFHWHAPRIIKNDKICAVEIHKRVLKKPYTYILNYPTLVKDSVSIGKFRVASFNNQLLIHILQKQLNDNLYFSKIIALKTTYDIYLLHVKKRAVIDRNINDTIDKKINNFLSCASFILNHSKNITYTKNKSSEKYLKSYNLLLENSTKEKTKIAFIDSYLKVKERFKIIQYSFVDKEYRTFTIRKIKQIDFYKKRLGIKQDP